MCHQAGLRREAARHIWRQLAGGATEDSVAGVAPAFQSGCCTKPSGPGQRLAGWLACCHDLGAVLGALSASLFRSVRSRLKVWASRIQSRNLSMSQVDPATGASATTLLTDGLKQWRTRSIRSSVAILGQGYGARVGWGSLCRLLLDALPARAADDAHVCINSVVAPL